MKRRILHVVPSVDRYGTIEQMMLLARELTRRGFDVHVCALSGGGAREAELAALGIPLTILGRRWKWDPGAFWRLRNCIRRFNPDVIHAWTYPANLYAYYVLGADSARKLVASHRCADWWKGPLELAVDRRIAGRCAKVVVNSYAVRDFYLRREMPAEKMLVIPNAVEAGESDSIARGELLAALALPSHSRLIAAMGPLQPHKRIKDAIWAADLLKVIRDDVHLLVLGDGPHRARLEIFRDRVEIRDKVHFLGQRADARRLLPRFDLLWSTSAHEGQSNAVLEAMAAGVPVVAADIPGASELIERGRSGFLVPVGDRAGFAKYANFLLNDPALANRIGSAGRQRARESFAVEAMVARYMELYESIS
jgi:glycosyltransferase involved in cell wall biosynthesis